MLIILDRDGVINQDSNNYIKNLDEWIPIPGSLEAIAMLTQLGHQVVIATNQSGIGRGLFTETTLHQIHALMQQQLAALQSHIDAIFYCPHHPDKRCPCRKPKPGLLLAIAEKFNIDLRQAVMIGDAKRDIMCANAVGCPAFLVKTGKGIATLAAAKKHEYNNLPIFENLAEAVNYLIKTARL